MFDLEVTRRFYVDYFGCTLDWQESGDVGPAFMQVSRGRSCQSSRRIPAMGLPAVLCSSSWTTSKRCMRSCTPRIVRS